MRASHVIGRTHVRRLLTLLLLAATAASAVAPQPGGNEADDLPRRGSLDVSLGSRSESPDAGAGEASVEVLGVLPGGAAGRAGIRAGDVFRAVDGVSVASATELGAVLHRHVAGDRVRIELLRERRPISATVVLTARKLETSTFADVLYRSVNAGASRRRTIVTRPRMAGRHPAVIFIGGLGCYSLDGELDRDNGYGPILAMLAKHGFVTMRVEKTGEGDSEGPPCSDPKATASAEADGYIAGIRALKQYDFVDPARILIFSHSIGPLIGSLVVPKESVRGFIAAETIGRSWIEYTLENVRRQRALTGLPLDEVDVAVRDAELCAHHFFVQHERPEHVEAIGPACARMLRGFGDVPYTYMQQVGDISLARQWKQADIPVLVIYGTSDALTSADESRYLVELINSFHPGRATYEELPGMAHGLTVYASQKEFMTDKQPHPYDRKLLDVILGWAEKHAGTPP